MIKTDKLIIVEGKYDKIKLSSLIDAPILETNGFRIFKDKEKTALIKAAAEKNGVLIITDSDSAGFIIRNYLKGIIKEDRIYHAYIPKIPGKEKRKEKPSKEGTLGVEGIDEKTLLECIKKSGALCEDEKKKKDKISKADFYEIGLTGQADSARRRKALLKYLNMPEYISANAMIDYFNILYSKEELKEIVNKLMNS